MTPLAFLFPSRPLTRVLTKSAYVRHFHVAASVCGVAEPHQCDACLQDLEAVDFIHRKALRTVSRHQLRPQPGPPGKRTIKRASQYSQRRTSEFSRYSKSAHNGYNGQPYTITVYATGGSPTVHREVGDGGDCTNTYDLTGYAGGKFVAQAHDNNPG